MASPQPSRGWHAEMLENFLAVDFITSPQVPQGNAGAAQSAEVDTTVNSPDAADAATGDAVASVQDEEAVGSTANALSLIEAQQSLKPLPLELSGYLTDAVKALLRKVKFFRSCIVQIGVDKDDIKFFGDLDNFAIRTKPLASAILPVFTFQINSKGQETHEVAVDPDTCQKVIYKITTTDKGDALHVMRHVGATSMALVGLEFVGPVALKATADKGIKETPVFRVLTAAAAAGTTVTFWWRKDSGNRGERDQEEFNCEFWLQARELAKGPPQNAWWFSRHEWYDHTRSDPFEEFFQSQSFLPSPKFLQPPDSAQTESLQLLPITFDWFPTRQAFLNIWRIGYLYEIEAVNSAHDATFNLSCIHKSVVSRVGDVLRVRVKISHTAERWISPDIGTSIHARLENAQQNGSETSLQGVVYDISQCGQEFTFYSDSSEVPEDMDPGTYNLHVTCSRMSQQICDEYEALATLDSSLDAHEESGLFDFWNTVLGLHGEVKPPLVTQKSQEKAEVSGISGLRARLDTEQAEFFNSAVYGQHPKGLLILQGYAGSGKSEAVASVCTALAISNLKVLIATKVNAAADAMVSKIQRLREDFGEDIYRAARFFGSSVAQAYKFAHAAAADEAGSAWRCSMENRLGGWISMNPESPVAKRFRQNDQSSHVDVLREMAQQLGVMVTTLGACKQARELSYQASVLVIDEASIMTDPCVALALTSCLTSIKMVILVGDPLQGIIGRQAPDSPLGRQMTRSILDRLWSSDPALSRFILHANRRQHPDVAAFASRYLCPEPMQCARPSTTSTARDLAITQAIQSKFLGFKGAYARQREAFVSVAGFEYRKDSMSCTNPSGVRAITHIIKQLLKLPGVQRPDIVVLSAYPDDAQDVATALERNHISGVHCTTADLFMGSEADIVIVHLVRAIQPNALQKLAAQSNPFGPVQSTKWLSVAMTRAREFCLVVGNFQAIENGTKLRHTANAQKYKGVRDLLKHFTDEGTVHNFIAKT